MEDRTYVAIDLKSFYASVECVERGLDPMTTNLVVADAERTEKTICLAVSPTLKAYGISGRARLFEVVEQVKLANVKRRHALPGKKLEGSSFDARELAAHPELALDYITARPQMAHYLAWSRDIYKIYLQYVAPEDIHVYSIDEVFIDLTDYLATYKLSARELVMKMILHVLRETGITATAGLGTNLYLAKVAMDIGAKHTPADENGVRIAELDEREYRRTLWGHKPLTDFWRVGRGYAKKLEEHGLHTMGDIARCSEGGANEYYNEDLLYSLFGVNAELLIDHAWGWEPCRIGDIKAYKSADKSIGSGQVLHSPYPCDKAKLIVREMTDRLVLDLVSKGLVTDQIVLTIGYDRENLTGAKNTKSYSGDVTTDFYGRKVPKHAHGTSNLEKHTSSTKRIQTAAAELFDHIIDERLLVRRVNIVAGHVVPESSIAADMPEQLDLFSDVDSLEEDAAKEKAELAREKKQQQAILDIQKKYGKNAILRGNSLKEGATMKERNEQIGGHRA